jgi:ABC-type dipeptide/oligopeptide/nickel transport system ATPase subunit
MAQEKEVLIEVKNLKKYFNVGYHQVLKAVDGVSFKIYKGETLGLVGESGCGKTTCGKTVMGLYSATGGEVFFDGVDIHSLNKREKKEFTKKAQIIFQDPYSSLDPRMTVEDIIGEGIDIHGLAKGQERQERIYELLETVGLNREHASRFPHEFSGGQRQRIGIARALAIEPEFIVCDEPIFRIGCLHSGAGGEPAGGIAAEEKADLSLYCARSVHGKAYFGSRGGDVSGQHGGVYRQRRVVPLPRCTPTHRRCFPPFPFPIRRKRKPSTGSPLRAKFQAPSIPNRAAGLHPAANMPRTSAIRKCRNSGKLHRGILWPATKFIDFLNRISTVFLRGLQPPERFK